MLFFAALTYNGTVRHLKYFIDFKSVVDKLFQTRTGNDRLNIADAVQKEILPAGIQFRKHVVQQKNRGVFCNFFYKLYFRKL